MSTHHKLTLLLIITAAMTSLLATGLFSFDVMAAEVSSGVGQMLNTEMGKWGFIAAALATGLSSLAAGYSVAMVGSAAVGALVEKPEMLGRVLILVGLAEGIAIYGLIISILILNRI